MNKYCTCRVLYLILWLLQLILEVYSIMKYIVSLQICLVSKNCDLQSNPGSSI